ncbi:transposase [Haloactinomyces albus]|uniref:SRSO17 transposase n=1 Tax=Haloactinomyces albus TaxID=1352928 RepID=A0AAE3Z8L3_9ACTN|nr:transposase [Haloactinomyces albus]MDR7300362.1 SRSO17 transposase [Haloactinomyces albus]
MAEDDLRSVGVQRQHSSTADHIENCQAAAFATYAGSAEHALIDRELYLPEQAWCADPARCESAGIPYAHEFATKPELARQMITRPQQAGLPLSRVTADELYGQSPTCATGQRPGTSASAHQDCPRPRRHMSATEHSHER